MEMRRTRTQWASSRYSKKHNRRVAQLSKILSTYNIMINTTRRRTSRSRRARTRRGGHYANEMAKGPATNAERAEWAKQNAERAAQYKMGKEKYEALQQNLPKKGRTQGQRCSSLAGWDNCKNPLKCKSVWEPYLGPNGSFENQCSP